MGDKPELTAAAGAPPRRSGPAACGRYDAGVQPPPPGFPQWGGVPDDPREHNEPGYSGQPTPPGYGQPPLPPEYGRPTPPGPDYPGAGYAQQPGYGPQQWGGYGPPAPAPTSQQKVGWITFAVVGLLGLLGAVLTLTLWINLDSAVNRAGEMCNRFSGEYARSCRQSVKHLVPSVPTALVVCLALIIAANVAATGGAVMLFLRKQLGQFLILGGGLVMLILAVGCEARYGATSRVTYDLIAGLIVAVVGGLMFIPAFRVLLGLPPKLTAGHGPGGGQWPYDLPPPAQYGPPGPPPPQW